VRDIFVRDRQTGTTTRLSKSSAGVQGNGDSYPHSISPDGRDVAFNSRATNLVPGDTNGVSDIFVRDRQNGTTTRISKSSAGVQGDAESSDPSISPDGRYVAFNSRATNLVPGDTNGAWDIFVRDRQTGTTLRVSKNTTGAQGNDASYSPSISSDGRFVAFDSTATNLVTGDTNGREDVFVRDRQNGTTARVSRNSAGVQGNDPSYSPSLSSDGRYVAFYSYASNLVAGDTNAAIDIFVRDRQVGKTTRVSKNTTGGQGNSGSYDPVITSDGRFVVFYSSATNLVPGDTNGVEDIFVRDRRTGTTTRVSTSSAGVQGDGDSSDSVISANGRYVAFVSAATNLVTGDTNGEEDIFVRDRWMGKTYLVSKS
jgi:Tol biopolymer transport system component